MEDHAGLSLLHDGVPLLGFALVFVLIFRRLGLGATLGFLVAGAVVGPQMLGLVGDAEGKLGIAELGIALLLFLVGLELSPSRLWRMRRARGRRYRLVRRRADPRRGAGPGPAAGALLDCAGAAAAAIGGAAADALGRARLCDPFVPGSVDRAADHDRRGDVA
jgi:hypothetical protein